MIRKADLVRDLQEALEKSLRRLLSIKMDTSSITTMMTSKLMILQRARNSLLTSVKDMSLSSF